MCHVVFRNMLKIHRSKKQSCTMRIGTKRNEVIVERQSLHLGIDVTDGVDDSLLEGVGSCHITDDRKLQCMFRLTAQLGRERCLQISVEHLCHASSIPFALASGISKFQKMSVATSAALDWSASVWKNEPLCFL